MSGVLPFSPQLAAMCASDSVGVFIRQTQNWLDKHVLVVVLISDVKRHHAFEQ